MFNYNFTMQLQLMMLSKNKQLWLTDILNNTLVHCFDVDIKRLITVSKYNNKISELDLNSETGVFIPRKLSAVACTFQEELEKIKISKNIIEIE